MVGRDDGLAALADARTAAMEAASELGAKKDAAFERQDFEGYERLATAYRVALTAQDKATQRLIAGIMNPESDDVRKLTDATADLRQRIAEFKAMGRGLQDLATALGILTQVILLFGML